VVETISHEELKEKMNRGDDFVLIDTLAGMCYRHSHLPPATSQPWITTTYGTTPAASGTG
jgi:hypothetical protein